MDTWASLPDSNNTTLRHVITKAYSNSSNNSSIRKDKSLNTDYRPR
jgi:hypothetical protein